MSRPSWFALGHAIGAVHAAVELCERDERGELSMTTLIPFVMEELCARLAECTPDDRVEALRRAPARARRWIGLELTCEPIEIYDDVALVVAALHEIEISARAES